MSDDAERMRKNAILARLPAREFDQISHHGEIIEAEIRHQVYQPGGPINDVHFPLSAVFSLVAAADEQIFVEVATIGHEGMVGLPLFLGASSSPHAAFCQIPGTSVQLSAEHLRRALMFDGALHQALNRATQATMVQVAQNVACNNTHDVEQRAARWLLTTRDRVDADEYPLTQQFLAQMLGVRRPTVSLTAGLLQSAGLIRYNRGQITIVDRAALEQASCDCYRLISDEYDRVLGP